MKRVVLSVFFRFALPVIVIAGSIYIFAIQVGATTP
ncbi:MAG: hypothetical protein UY52_C0011G0046 [Parcubacteria group bacterium GW2011_GWC2_49_9]|nr:MAG: hypothetical protein UY34_C0019G0034 [Parcubacteria group bacterium GW2011_GWA2_48_9]KKW16058.1 MAG: hypothetical protein UY52_C0011G0046 [Parcubacteria group bacterium GW2011_GWC2_49_9]